MLQDTFPYINFILEVIFLEEKCIVSQHVFVYVLQAFSLTFWQAIYENLLSYLLVSIFFIIVLILFLFDYKEG
jgi:hypothetical protein